MHYISKLKVTIFYVVTDLNEYLTKVQKCRRKIL